MREREQLTGEWRAIRHQLATALPLLAEAVVEHRATETYSLHLVRDLWARQDVCELQLAAYDPQQALFPDEPVPHSYPGRGAGGG